MKRAGSSLVYRDLICNINLLWAAFCKLPMLFTIDIESFKKARSPSLLINRRRKQRELVN